MTNEKETVKNTEAGHTPTPWKVIPDSTDIISICEDISERDFVATVFNRNLSNAEFIIRAVNSHEALRTIVLRYLSLNEMNKEIERINSL